MPFTTLRLYSTDLKEDSEDSFQAVLSHSEVLSEPVDYLRSFPQPCLNLPPGLCLIAIQATTLKIDLPLLRVPDIALPAAQEWEKLLEMTLPEEVLLFDTILRVEVTSDLNKLTYPAVRMDNHEITQQRVPFGCHPILWQRLHLEQGGKTSKTNCNSVSRNPKDHSDTCSAVYYIIGFSFVIGAACMFVV